MILVGDGSEEDSAYFKQFSKLVKIQNSEGRAIIEMDERIRPPEQINFLLGIDQVAESLRSELRALTLQEIAA